MGKFRTIVEGSGTVLGVMRSLVGVGRVGDCPAWAGRGLGISSTIVDGVQDGTGIYTDLGVKNYISFYGCI